MKIKAIIALVLLVILTYFTAPYWTHSTKEVTVTSSMVKPSNGESKYLVYTDAGVFENTDTWYYFKFDSSDVQSKLMQNGKFKVSYYGFRVPFLSKYPNITNVERK
jgi:hypothetical protein